MGRISAIVSAYYCEDYLDDRLKNLFEQDGIDLQVIVVCQFGSSEAEIANMYAGVKIIETAGIPTVYEAWNLGITHSTGEYITNANSDDRLYPGALAQLSQALDADPGAAVAYANCDKVLKHGSDPIGLYDWATGGLAQLHNGCFLGPMPMWRRRLHDLHDFFDATMRSAGDYEYWLRLAFRGERFVKVPGVCGAYQLRYDSLEHKDPILSSWEAGKAKSRYSLRKWWSNYEDVHAGATCFILGNGPSLNDIDLQKLKGITFGSNRIYLSGFIPNFHVTVNPLVLEQYGKEIAALPCEKFRAGYEIDTSEDVARWTSPIEPMYEGHTVTYIALQLAYFMGFERVILLGVDHDYGPGAQQGKPGDRVIGGDTGHFTADYFPGAWHLPNLAQSEMSYKLARDVYQDAGREIVNASTRTKLDIFPRIELGEVIK